MTVEINFFFSWSRFLKFRLFSWEFEASRFLSRLLRHIKIVEICRDAVEICRGLLSLKMMKSLDGLRNLDKKIQKSTHFLIEIETNCQETPKFLDLDEILDLGQDFLVWTLMSRQNRDISIVETYFLTLSRFSRLSRLTLWRRRDRDSRSRHDRDKSRPPCLGKIHHNG